MHASKSVSAQISPTLWTSAMSGVTSESGAVVGSAAFWRMCVKVKGFFARSDEYGAYARSNVFAAVTSARRSAAS